MPRIMFMVASVTINGGIFIFVIITPFTAPNKMPTVNEINTARIDGTPIHEINIVVRQPASDIYEPTDKSIPPANNTNDIPNAESAVAEIVRRIII